MAEPMEDDIQLTEIARGRRITAVAVTDLNMTPRRTERPEKPSNQATFLQRLFRSGHSDRAEGDEKS